MNMKSKYLKIVAMGLAAIVTLNSCRESIDEGARFTFVGNTVATYLEGEEDCSHFIEILTRGECIGLMKAYGTYTCFAPTNAAVERFLIEQDSIYWASVEKHKENPEFQIVETVHAPVKGTKPRLEDISDEKCGEIARNHILPKVYLGIHFKGNIIPEANINDRDLTLEFDTVNNKYYPVINKQARVIREEEVENGVVHVVEGVIDPSSKSVATLLSDYPYFSIFYTALVKTGYAEMLVRSEDESYTDGDKYGKSMNESTMVPYPAARRLGYTIFAETNEVFAKYGVDSYEKLVEKCKDWYDEGDPVWAFNSKTNEWEETTIQYGAEPTSPRSPINQFVGYHLLDRKLSYEYLVFHDIKAGSSYDSEDDFPKNSDRTEYYVTMNNRVLKVTKPLSAKDDIIATTIYLNLDATKERDYNQKGQGLNVKVYRPNEFVAIEGGRYSDYNQEALNGSLNVIDDVLYYDENKMVGQALNCIMRFDMAGVCPELTNNRIRWRFLHELTSQGDVVIPHKYCRDIKVYAENTRLFYLPPHSNWGDYQGDEMMAKGIYDFAYRLPPVPDGTYEIRLGYTAEAGMRGIVQVYVDDEVTGIPIDLSLAGTNEKIGWKEDTKDEEEILSIDKDMKNRGFLKAPDSFYGYDAKGKRARAEARCLRAIIATKKLSGYNSHWIRFKDVDQINGGKREFMHDYIEIVSTDYLRSLDVKEEEKRH